MPSGIREKIFEGRDGRFFWMEKSSKTRSRRKVMGLMILRSPSLLLKEKLSQFRMFRKVLLEIYQVFADGGDE